MPSVDWATTVMHAQTSLGISVSGLTQEAAPNRLITLGFAVEHFWVTDYLALPYIMLHELIAHAACGVSLADSQSYLSASFHEGWMDAIALQVLSLYIRSPSVPGCPVHKRAFDVDEMGKFVHGERLKAVKPALPDTKLWRDGTTALRVFETAVGLALPIAKRRKPDAFPGVTPADLTIRFSLEANASGQLSHAKRGRFVWILCTRFSDQNPASERQRILADPVLLKFVDWILGQITTFGLAKHIAGL